MSETLERVDASTLLGFAHAAVDALIGTAAGSTGDDRVAVLRSIEQLRRKLPAVEHDVLLAMEQDGTAVASGARSTAGFLAQLLNLDAPEAAARVHAAHACGHRRSLTGEVLQPLFPVVAAAQAEGRLSERERRIITDCVERLPGRAIELGSWIEADLVSFTATLAPKALKHTAERINYLYDQDGSPDETERRRRNRTVTVVQRPDGTSHGTFEATAELTEFLLTTFDSLARPQPAADGVKDPRTPGQRRHDALLDVLKLATRSQQLPKVGGVLATVVLTVSAQDWLAGTGFVMTGHGAQVPLAEAGRWAGGDARVVAVALNSIKAVVAYGTTHRIFTEGQRLAMIARDQGCSFPGCGAGPAWTEAHHVIEHVDGGPTVTDNGALVCGYHHREFARLGWSVRMTDGLPEWIPPRWLDPRQRPRR